eukprot:m.850942 g.850942  ORF g.850942 m.850942 type:complete len:82 (-) comp23491_c0_seq64:4708-4953(-)
MNERRPHELEGKDDTFAACFAFGNEKVMHQMRGEFNAHADADTNVDDGECIDLEAYTHMHMPVRTFTDARLMTYQCLHGVP